MEALTRRRCRQQFQPWPKVPSLPAAGSGAAVPRTPSLRTNTCPQPARLSGQERADRCDTADRAVKVLKLRPPASCGSVQLQENQGDNASCAAQSRSRFSVLRDTRAASCRGLGASSTSGLQDASAPAWWRSGARCVVRNFTYSSKNTRRREEERKSSSSSQTRSRRKRGHQSCCLLFPVQHDRVPALGGWGWGGGVQSGQRHAGSGAADVWVGARLRLPTPQLKVAGRWRAAGNTEAGAGTVNIYHHLEYLSIFVHL